MRPRTHGGRITVGDLFCGAGGFSEGFKQAGFEIAWGVDNWAPAIRTFEKNHPGAKAINANILSLDPQKLRDAGEVDVLIGSPPCIHFSAANRGGNGDRSEGLRLVRRFLTFVKELEPKYWVMENVAGLLPDLRREMFGQVISLNSGNLRIPRMELYDASVFGTPQIRRRSISGSFPIPNATHGPIALTPRSLRSVLEALPDPSKPRPRDDKRVPDPVYEGVSVTSGALRDHFEDNRWKLRLDERRSSQEKKIRNSVYGIMSYPDDIDRPARTITATRTRGSRMTIVVPYGRQGRRTLTLRESASAQGFPLSYQFWGESMSERDTLVGNAVPPPMARAIASAILEKEGRAAPSSPIVVPPEQLAPALSPRRIDRKYFSPYRRCRAIVGLEWRHNRRVELDNQFEVRDTVLPESGIPGSTDWKARLYLGYAKEYRSYEVRFEQALALASSLSQGPNPIVTEEHWARMFTPLLLRTSNGFPSAGQLQAVWTGRSKRFRGPFALCDWVADLVRGSFPDGAWKDLAVPSELTRDILLQSADKGHGKEAEEGQPLPMTVRLVASSIALSLVCERLDNGSDRLERLLREVTAGPGFLARGPFAHGQGVTEARAKARSRVLASKSLDTYS